MDKNSQNQKLRTLIHSIFCKNCKVGLLVDSYPNRDKLGDESLACLHKIIDANFPVEKDISHECYFDQGIPFKNKASLRANCKYYFNQNSILIGGIQVADYIAHTLAIILKDSMGFIQKYIDLGVESGWNEPVSIGFELWAGIRRNFFSQDISEAIATSCYVDVESYGLHIPISCDYDLRNITLKRFGKNYLGCIH